MNNLYLYDCHTFYYQISIGSQIYYEIIQCVWLVRSYPIHLACEKFSKKKKNSSKNVKNLNLRYNKFFKF